MKKVLVFLVMVGVAFGAPRLMRLSESNLIPLKVENPFDHNEVGPRQSTINSLTGVVVDSAGNQYTAFYAVGHECIAWSDVDGESWITIVNRAFDDVGRLHVNVSNDNGASWCQDLVYDYEEGEGARYPTAVAGDMPRATYPVLAPGPAWGHGFGSYGSGGYCGGVWDPPVNITGDIGVHKVVGKVTDDGNVLIIMETAEPRTLWYNTTEDFTVVNDNGELFEGMGVGTCTWDYRDGKAVVVGFVEGAGLYYTVSEDNGATWSIPEPWDFVYFPLFDGPGYIWWQVVLTSTGDPVLVVALTQQHDQVGHYPVIGGVYVSTNPAGDTLMPINTVRDPSTGALIPVLLEYPGPAIGTGVIGDSDVVCVVWGHDDNLADSTIGAMVPWDIYANISYDGGKSWGVPINLTNSADENENVPVIAKRIDYINNLAHIFFVESFDGSDIYYDVENDIIMPIYIKYMNHSITIPGPKEWEVRNELLAVGDGSTTHFEGKLKKYPIAENSVVIYGAGEILTDDGAGNLSSDAGGTGTIDYDNGAYSFDLANVPPEGVGITADYTGSPYGGGVGIEETTKPYITLLPTFSTKEVVFNINTNVPSPANLRVYDVSGKLVYKRSIDLKKGENTIRWRPDVSSGVFFYLMETSEGLYKGKITLVR